MNIYVLVFVLINLLQITFSSASWLRSFNPTAPSTTTPTSYIVDLRRKSLKLQEVIPDEMNENLEENEASPSLLRKKVGKILTKLSLLARINNAYHYKPEEIEEEDHTEEVRMIEAPKPSESANIQQIPLAPHPTSEVQSDVTSSVEIDIGTDKLKEENGNRLGTLGVFFVELLGSIVGLTYGAVAQIAAGGQSPVTVSTSEGL